MAALVHGSGGGDLVRTAVLGAVAANVVNNLPALLVALPHVGGAVWALLLGVNMGPAVVVTGSLAALLWRSSLERLGVPVTAGRFAAVGATVVLPALAGALIVLLAQRPIVG